MDRGLIGFGAVMAAVVVLVSWAVVRDGSDAPSTPDETATAASNSPTAGETATSAATPGPTPTPIPVSLEPNPDLGMPLPARSLGPAPASTFPPWTGTNAIIYDTETGETIDLGLGTFSPDGKWATWKAGDRTPSTASFFWIGEVRLINLETREQRTIGEGLGAMFPDSKRVALLLPRIQQENSEWKLFDIDDLRPSSDQTTTGQTPNERVTSTGHILVNTPVAGTELPRGGYGTTHFQLLDPVDRHLVMEFDAYRAVDATETELVVASAWAEIPTEPFVSHPVNLFILDVRTGKATHFAFARASTPNWPLSANKDWVLWTNNFCGAEGFISPLLQDRDGLPFGILQRGAGGEMVDFEPGDDNAYMVLTPRGLIAQGSFGAHALIDPVTMEYVAVLPEVQLVAELRNRGQVEPRWDPSYRHAAYWQGGGHGGLC